VRRAFGRVASGLLRSGDELLALPSLKTARVASLSVGAPEAGGRALAEAPAGRWVAVDFDSPVPLRRGDLLVRPHNLPHRADLLDTNLLMLSRETPLTPGMQVVLQIGPARFPATFDEVRYRLEVEGLHRRPAEALGANEIGRGLFSLDEPRWLDTVRRNRRLGSFLVLSPDSLDILAAGFIRDLRESHPEAVGQVVWLTGLPASGKSTIARATIDHLAELGYEGIHLDGDVFRGFVSDDLGFSTPDRRENIRRAAGVAALLASAGHLIVASFVSPSRADREAARNQVGPGRFLEVYIETPLEICRKRDPKGLYAKADRGEIAEFTGVGAPYEAPEAPELRIDTGITGIAEAADRIVALLRLRGALTRPVRQRPGAADPSPERRDPL
ncbi:MAG: adenylyl-sulfate kinase, partial [Spirochaetaceae bacterium]